MQDRQSKNLRTLDLFVRFLQGRIVRKAEEAERFQVDQRTIQRDIDDIRAFLDECAVKNTADSRTIVYDRSRRGFVLTGSDSSLMTNTEIFAVSKILLESRAFTKKEMDSILRKLISGCVPQENISLVRELIANEQYHYIELHHKSRIQNKLWELGSDSRKGRVLKIKYQKQQSGKGTSSRLIVPVGIMFSEYYFYLNAYIVKENSDGSIVREYEYPAIFRVDRIKDYRDTGKTMKIEYADRFEEGEFRKRIQFMYAGKLLKIRFKFTGPSIEAVLDRLPTARIAGEIKNGYMVEAEVYGKGIIMWLLSQGSYLEVVKPSSLRSAMKDIISDMLGKYK